MTTLARPAGSGPESRPLRAPVFAIVVPIVLAGCATLGSPQREHLASPDASLRDCAAWFAALDRAIDAHGVRDGSAHRVDGFPYLRVDRFAASFRDEQMDDARLRAWVERLGSLDATARRYETRTLPDAALVELGLARRGALLEQTLGCADRLMRQDLAAPATRGLLAARAAVPDDYATWKRVAGLYALTRIPFFAGVSRWQEDVAALFRAPSPDVPGRIVRYAPAERRPSAARVRDILSRIDRDALGIALPDEAQQRLLFAAFAPEFAIAVAGDFDRPGALHWPADGATTPAVDSTRPVVYHRLAHTRWGGRVRLQLVYALWFSERPLEGPLDLLGGRLDGLVWRVTLGDDGTPLIYDTIHSCGCYQMFFPANGVAARPPPAAAVEWAFVPATLPAHDSDSRLLVRLDSGSHYVNRVSVIDPAATADGAHATPYSLAPDDELRALPLPGGGNRSVFGPDGIIPGSERGERFLFWPMGVASPGAMRQWGRHATAFVGRRHFDDPDLFELRFSLPPSRSAPN